MQTSDSHVSVPLNTNWRFWASHIIQRKLIKVEDLLTTSSTSSELGIVFLKIINIYRFEKHDIAIITTTTLTKALFSYFNIW